MQRGKLERYIGSNVEITLFDGSAIEGILYKTGTKRYQNNPDLYLRKNFYVLENVNDTRDYSCIFRCSHVKKLVAKEDEADSYHDNYTSSATNRDYGPSNPWDAPGMSIRDFI